MKKRLSISLILALCFSMLFATVAFANNTTPGLDLDDKGITLTPPTANQAPPDVIDAAAKDTFGIYLGKNSSAKSINWDHDGWTEWRNVYTQKRACCETTAYENGVGVYHYSAAWLGEAGLVFGYDKNYGTGDSHAESDWGYAGFTAYTGYGVD